MRLKRIPALFLVLCMLLQVAAAGAWAAEPPDYSGTVGDSGVCWEFDPDTGKLIISGSGVCTPFASADDQPWRQFREQITEVWFYDMGDLAIPDLAYWFTGCSSLKQAELPYTTPLIGTDAFARCPSLNTVLLYYTDPAQFTITPGAFHTDSPLDTTIRMPLQDGFPIFEIRSYPWGIDNRHIKVTDIYGFGILAQGCMLGPCTCTNCDWYYEYYAMDDTYCGQTVCCTGCDASFVLGQAGAHSMSGDTCTRCGYTYEITCDHGRIYTRWPTNCRWIDYCYYCDEWMDSGYSHSYVYDEWAYYNTSYHRRSYTCTYGDAGTNYQNQAHSKVMTYSQHSETQHKAANHCAICGSDVGAVSYADHNDGNGDGSCDLCGYVTARFSVTLPTSMSLAMDESGEIYTASNLQIVNNSTDAVRVASVTAQAGSGWTLVPYGYNMARAKVNADMIGFSINGAVTSVTGARESLALNGGWEIAKGSALALSYDAVVSATSRILNNEQVLTLIFVLEWAD